LFDKGITQRQQDRIPQIVHSTSSACGGRSGGGSDATGLRASGSAGRGAVSTGVAFSEAVVTR
jgi:hypothetical protein